MLAIAIICGIVIAVVTGAPEWATSEVAAAWGQAILSVAAILASASLWRADRERERRERRQRQEIADFRVAVLHSPLFTASQSAIAGLFMQAGIGEAYPSTREGFDLHLSTDLLEPLANIVTELEGCSPPLEADALAAAAWARQYIHQAARRQGHRQDAIGSPIYTVTYENWAVLKPALEGAMHRVLLTLQRMQEILDSPPDLSDR
jgi:hypothetical protein